MTAIKVEGVSKKYSIGSGKQNSLRASFANMLRKKRSKKDLWALKDISFQLPHGEALGIIGRNGSGKSTLLKILSRITSPTTGRIEIEGRVATLLEVGTGFHPELTGRENIFLNGQILGMPRTVIKKQLESIVAFSEIEHMIDSPVKHYSSGMYVRLAFAVAAHLNTDILLLDEILAVGDAAFQKKCLELIKSSTHQKGKTILFVSHDLGSIEQLCKRSILLESGQIVNDGPSNVVINQYLREAEIMDTPIEHRLDREGNGSLRITSVIMYNADGKNSPFVECGKDCYLKISIENKTNQPYKTIHLNIGLNAPSGQRISWISNQLTGRTMTCLRNGRLEIQFTLKNLPLVPGMYSVNFYLTNEIGLADWVRNGFFFIVRHGPFYSSGQLPPENQAIFLLNHDFKYDVLS